MYLLSIQEENVSCGDAPPFIKSYEKKAFQIVILLTLNSINTF